MSSLTIAIIVVFIIGYFFIAIESVTEINKAAIVVHDVSRELYFSG